MPAKKSPKRRTPMDVAVGINVRTWRLAMGLSQEQLARRLGVTFQQVQKYEAGANRVGTGRLVKVAGILGIPIAVLFDGAEGAGHSRSLLVLIADKRAFRLARAFASIPQDTPENRTARETIVKLVEQIAKTVPQPQRRRRK
jgi:transcriptional regulator with XRE-family HTH domain